MKGRRRLIGWLITSRTRWLLTSSYSRRYNQRGSRCSERDNKYNKRDIRCSRIGSRCSSRSSRISSK